MSRWLLRARVDAPEWIDSPEALPPAIRANLRDQAWVNRRLGGGRAALAHAAPLLRACGSDPIWVLDAACGGADLSRCLVDAAHRMGKRVRVVALDCSPTVLRVAQECSAGYPEIAPVCADLLRLPFAPASFDLILMATCLHHFSPEQVVAVLRAAGRMSRGRVVAADLVRDPLAFLAFRVSSRLLHFHPMSRHDGAASVVRAYTPRELAALARQAGLTHWRIYRHALYRMALVYPGGSDLCR